MTESKTIKVELSPSYEIADDSGLWVEVDGVWHISPMIMEDKIWGKLSEDTLCGLTKIGFGREWGYRLAAGEEACKVCVEKGKYTADDSHNMQRFKLVKYLKKRKAHVCEKQKREK